MTENKFLDDLIKRCEAISERDRGINLKAEFKAFDDSEFEFLKENIDEVIESIKTFAKEAYEHFDMTVDDVPESLRAEIYEDGERAGYEQGSFGGLTMNLQDEIKELKQRIAELEYHAKEEREFPQNGDEYWCIGDWLLPTRSIYEDDYTDRGRKQSGNIYKTKEQAEFVVEKLKVEAELRKFSRPFEEDKDNYFMVFDTSDGSIHIWNIAYSTVQGTIYFESEEKAQQAIQSVGEERIKKYIFGVED